MTGFNSLAQVYHDLVPVVCDMLGGDRSRITAALMGGSLLPLAMFVAWTAVTLAVMPAAVRSGLCICDTNRCRTDCSRSSMPHCCFVMHRGFRVEGLRWLRLLGKVFSVPMQLHGTAPLGQCGGSSVMGTWTPA